MDTMSYNELYNHCAIPTQNVQRQGKATAM